MSVNSSLHIDRLNKKINAFSSVSTKVTGKRPIHRMIREYAEIQSKIVELIPMMDFVQLQNLKIINNQVKLISEAKCSYYLTSSFGVFKRIYSCFLNAIFFGMWTSSGHLGLVLSQQVAAQIESREMALQAQSQMTGNNLTG